MLNGQPMLIKAEQRPRTAILQRALSAARGVVRASPRMTVTSYLFISHEDASQRSLIQRINLILSQSYRLLKYSHGRK